MDWNRIPWVSFGRRETPNEFRRKCDEQRERLVCLAYRPHFSILINATHIESAADLRWTLRSLEEQTYPYFNAYLWVSEEVKRQCAVTDSRIALFTSPRIHFGEMLHKAKSLPQAEWCLVFRGGDFLSPAALFQFAWEMSEAPGPELFYPQEVVVDLSGRKAKISLLSKCRDSRYTLLHFNYVGRCFAFHSDLARRIEQAENVAYPGEYEWLLKARGVSGEFGLVPGYWHYRNEKFSLPIFESNPEATRKALAEWVVNADAERSTERPEQGTRILPLLPVTGGNRISAVICFRDRAEMTFACVQRLMQCQGDLPLEVILVDNGSKPEEAEWIRSQVQRLPQSSQVRVISFPEAFNFGRMNNWAVSKHTTGDILLFLNNDVTLSEGCDLDGWAAWALQSDVGTVGICLRFPNGSVQHCGIRASFGGRSHLFRIGNSHRQDRLTFLGREVFANTFAACMVRREVFLGAGGLNDIDMANGFGDVALNLDLRRQGLKNLYLGYVEGVHAEGASRGHGYEYWEEVRLERKFSDTLFEMVRADLSCSVVPIAEVDLATAFADSVKSQIRGISWLNPVKPALKRLAHVVWPSQSHLPI